MIFKWDNLKIYFQDFSGGAVVKNLPSSDFPGGAVVGNPPANAGDTGSSPGPGESHMPRSNWACVPQLLSLCSGARKPQLLGPRA